MTRPTAARAAAYPWRLVLSERARWLVPLALLVLLVLVKEWPPASCGKGG